MQGHPYHIDAVMLAHAVSLKDEGVNELAWERAMALQFAEAVAADGYVILGGDVWRRDPDGRWRPTYDN